MAALLRESSHRLEYHNPSFQRPFLGHALHNRTLAEVASELAAQGMVAELNRVCHRGGTRVF